MKGTKKLLAALLSAILLMALLPTSAGAAEPSAALKSVQLKGKGVVPAPTTNATWAGDAATVDGIQVGNFTDTDETGKNENNDPRYEVGVTKTDADITLVFNTEVTSVTATDEDGESLGTITETPENTVVVPANTIPTDAGKAININVDGGVNVRLYPTSAFHFEAKTLAEGESVVLVLDDGETAAADDTYTITLTPEKPIAKGIIGPTDVLKSVTATGFADTRELVEASADAGANTIDYPYATETVYMMTQPGAHVLVLTAQNKATDPGEGVGDEIIALDPNDDINTVVSDLVELDVNEIADAMEDPDVVTKIEAIEDAYVTQNKAKQPEIDVDSTIGASTGIDTGDVTAVGLALNAPNATDVATLKIAPIAPAAQKPLPSNVDSTKAVPLEITLSAGSTPITTLKVPVQITMPIPTGLTSAGLVLLHWNGSSYDEVMPLVFNPGGTTVTFTVTGFSPYVLTARALTSAENMLTKVQVGATSMTSDKFPAVGKQPPNANMAVYGTNSAFWVGNYNFVGNAYTPDKYYEILVATWDEDVVLTFAADVDLDGADTPVITFGATSILASASSYSTDITAVDNVLTMESLTEAYYWVVVDGVTFFIIPTVIVTIEVSGDDLAATDTVDFEISALDGSKTTYSATAENDYTVYVTVDPAQTIEVVDLDTTAPGKAITIAMDDGAGSTWDGTGPYTVPNGAGSITAEAVVEPGYAYGPVASKTENNVTATVTFSETDLQAEGAEVEATVTLTGTAAAAGDMILDLTSALGGLVTDPRTVAVTASQDLTSSPETEDNFVFTMPAADVKDFNLTLTFVPTGSYAYIAPSPVLGNGVTATVTFDPAGPIVASTSTEVEATITFTGAATLAGTYTINLESDDLSLAEADRTQKIAIGAKPTNEAFTFTFPATANVTDFVLTFTFAADPVTPPSGGGSGGSGSNGSWPSDYNPIPTAPPVVTPPTTPSVNNPFSYRVLARSLNVRSGPGTSYAKVGSLSANSIVSVIGYSTDATWAQLSNGTWVSMAYVAQVNAITGNGTYSVSVKSGTLNVRSGPGTNNAKIGSLTNGQLVTVYSIVDGWAQIQYAGGIGYVSTMYLR